MFSILEAFILSVVARHFYRRRGGDADEEEEEEEEEEGGEEGLRDEPEVPTSADPLLYPRAPLLTKQHNIDHNNSSVVAMDTNDNGNDWMGARGAVRYQSPEIERNNLSANQGDLDGATGDMGFLRLEHNPNSSRV